MVERPSPQTEPNKREVSLDSYFATLGNRIDLRRISHSSYRSRPFHPAKPDDVIYLLWNDNYGAWRKMRDGTEAIADVGLYGDPGVPDTPYYHERRTFDETPWFKGSIKKFLWDTFLLTKAELSNPLQHSSEQLIEFARANIRGEVLIERLKEMFPKARVITGWEKPTSQAT